MKENVGFEIWLLGFHSKKFLSEAVDDENFSIRGIELIQFRQSLRTYVYRKLFFWFHIHQWSTPGSCCPSDGWVIPGIMPVVAGRDEERGVWVLLEEDAELWRRGLKLLEVRVSLGESKREDVVVTRCSTWYCASDQQGRLLTLGQKSTGCSLYLFYFFAAL